MVVFATNISLWKRPLSGCGSLFRGITSGKTGLLRLADRPAGNVDGAVQEYKGSNTEGFGEDSTQQKVGISC